MRESKITSTPNSAKRRGVFVLIPLLILLVDFIYFPTIWETHREQEDADITYLLTHETQSLGSFQGHGVYLSMDDILDPRFLHYLNQHGNALVISVFTNEGVTATGALLRAVRQRLERLSPKDYRKLVDRLDKKESLTPGDTILFPLALPGDKYHEFPIDYLFILVYESGNVEEKELGNGIKQILELAQQERIANLVFPCVGIHWESKHSLEFNKFFNSFFSNLSATEGPFNIYLSLYTQWPSFVLEEAVASVNDSWHAVVQQPHPTPTLYRGSFRLIILSLSLCLLVSSFFAKLTLISFFVISLSFVASAILSNKFIDFFTEGYPTVIRSIVQITVLIVLSSGFPFIVSLSAQKIFKKGEK